MSAHSTWWKTSGGRVRRAGALLVASALILGGCADAVDSVAGIPPGAADGLYPQIAVSAPSASTAQINISLLRKPRGVRLGSYQGEFTYDPSVLTLERWSLPAGVDGVVNDETAGRIRFVGTALDGVGEVPLLALHFTRRQPIGAQQLAVSFQEVSAAGDFSDLTALVFAGAPAVSGLPK